MFQLTLVLSQIGRQFQCPSDLAALAARIFPYFPYIQTTAKTRIIQETLLWDIATGRFRKRCQYRRLIPSEPTTPRSQTTLKPTVLPWPVSYQSKVLAFRNHSKISFENDMTREGWFRSWIWDSETMVEVVNVDVNHHQIWRQQSFFVSWFCIATDLV